jgi:hypothetical protein
MSILGFIKKVAAQTAVYWPSPQNDGQGNMIWGDPVELKVRWDNTTKLIRDAKGKEVACQAEILVAGQLQNDGTVTPIDLDVDGRLYLGSIDDLDSGQVDDPMQVAAFAIIRFDKNPLCRKVDKFVRTAYL